MSLQHPDTIDQPLQQRLEIQLSPLNPAGQLFSSLIRDNCRQPLGQAILPFLVVVVFFF